MLDDSVEIVFIVLSPIIFFILLFLSAFLYRRHKSPFRKGSFRQSPSGNPGSPTSNTEKGAIWDPNLKETIFPHCHLCYIDHSKDPSSSTVNPGSDLGGKEVLVDRAEFHDQFYSDPKHIINLKVVPATSAEQNFHTKFDQPHFTERNLTIRRISSNPFLPDTITRVNSVSSTLNGSGSNANPSSDVLPYGGGRRSSHASSLVPNSLGGQNVEANSLAIGVIAVGDRRPSVLSGGLSDRCNDEDEDRLSIRKISAGGQEDLMDFKGVNIDVSRLPVRRFSTNEVDRKCKSVQGQCQSGSLPTLVRSPGSTSSGFDKTGREVPCPHPFSSASLGRNLLISKDPVTEFSVPHIKLPEKAKSRTNSRQRPGTLKIPSLSSQHPSAPGTQHIVRTNSLVMPSASSTQAIKSAPEPKSSLDTCSSFGHEPDHQPPPKSAQFFPEGWNGFQAPQDNGGGQSTKAGMVIPRIEIPISPTTPTPKIDLTRSNTRTRKGTPSAALEQLNSYTSSSITGNQINTQTEDGENQSNHKRTPSNSSRITYLADVVKHNEEEEKRLSSIQNTPVNLYPPGDALVESKKSIVSDRPPSLSPLRLEHGLGVHSAIAAGMGIGMVVGMSQGEVQVEGDEQPRAI